MTVTAVDLINAALRRAGGNRDISAIDDTTPGGAIAGDVYTGQRDLALRAHPWNFSIVRARLGRLTITPRFEYSYAYGLPSDWMRTVSVHDNEAGMGQADYKQETPLTGEVLTNGAFDTDTIWSKGTGWTIGSGMATHASGSGSDLSQSGSFVASGLYRVTFLITGMSAGTLTPKFTGGTTITGTARSADGYHAEELTAHSGGGNNTFVLTASSTFNANVDDVSCVYLAGGASPAIMSSASEIWLRYVRQVTNPDHMDPLFREVLTLRMAKIFGLALASSSTFYQMLDEDMNRAVRLAKSTDAIEDQPERWPEGSWATARWAGRDSRSGWGSWR